MPAVFWGAIGDIYVAWPDTVAAWLLLLCYGFLFLALLFRGRARLRRLDSKRWALLLVLIVLAAVFNTSLPPQVVPWSLQLLPFNFTGSHPLTISLLSAVPYVLGGAVLGPTSALLIGFFTGLGRALGLTHQPFAPFHFAFAAWLASQLMQQRFFGRFYRWLRLPLVSGTLSQVSTAFLAALAAFLNVAGSLLASADTALAVFEAQFWPMLVEGLVAGVIVTGLLITLPQWRRQGHLVPSPGQRSIRNYLLIDFSLFGAAIMLLTAASIFIVTLFLSTQLLIAQMAATSNAASLEINEYRNNLENVLSQYGDEEELARGDKASTARALGRVYRAAQHFRPVMLVDDQMSVTNTFPEQETATTLTELEQAAVSRVLAGGTVASVVVDLPNQERVLSIIAPVLASDGEPATALIGRVSVEGLIGIFSEARIGNGRAYILDPLEKLVVSTGSDDFPADWTDLEESGEQSVFVPTDLGGKAFLRKNQRQSRDMIYQTSRAADWRVVMVVPYETALNQALIGPFAIALIFLMVTAVFYVRLARYGHNLASPIASLAKTSRSIAAGGNLTVSVDTDRRDEIGDLSLAFTGMQRALKGRLEDLSLLLTVSQDISTSININQSMPVILQGALRGTGASAARVVILNPSGRVPITFAEGPAGAELATLDRSLMVYLRQEAELALSSPRQIREFPGLADALELPVRALFAIALRSQNMFQGVFFVGYRQAQDFSSSERTLLHTLAGQATILVENARLFANAEGGRQRMAAVLASTTEAVIVTDQTGRVVIINGALEQAFQVTTKEIIGRYVADVIPSQQLVLALTQGDSAKRNLKIDGKDGRIYEANVAGIVSEQGKVMGQVAVLHDVTRLKEIDSMKSDFVNNVSHDLRTPLTVVSGLATALAMSDDLSPEQKEYTENIVLSVERIVGLVDNLLDLGRIEAGVGLLFDDVDVASLLEELVDDHWLYAHDSGVKVRLKLAQDLPLIRADRTLLYQAAANLLSNGFKYAADSGDMILMAGREGENVVISLHDNGPGIARQDQIHLFEKGYRLKRHGSGKVKGSGLGLAIVKSIAERHQGRCWCESEPGKGSTFYISIPINGRVRKEDAR